VPKEIANNYNSVSTNITKISLYPNIRKGSGQGFTTQEFTSTRFAQVNSTGKLDSRTRTSLPKIKIK